MVPASERQGSEDSRDVDASGRQGVDEDGLEFEGQTEYWQRRDEVEEQWALSGNMHCDAGRVASVPRDCFAVTWRRATHAEKRDLHSGHPLNPSR